MPSQNIMSLTVGRMAGQNAGVPTESLGKSGPERPNSTTTKKVLKKFADGKSKKTK